MSQTQLDSESMKIGAAIIKRHREIVFATEIEDYIDWLKYSMLRNVGFMHQYSDAHETFYKTWGWLYTSNGIMGGGVSLTHKVDLHENDHWMKFIETWRSSDVKLYFRIIYPSAHLSRYFHAFYRLRLSKDLNSQCEVIPIHEWSPSKFDSLYVFIALDDYLDEIRRSEEKLAEITMHINISFKQ